MTMSLRPGGMVVRKETVTIGAQLTSTQKGKVTEQLVASALLIASNDFRGTVGGGYLRLDK